jgi:nitrate/TMAO reductase-like tetraheme cytochrome c subunit
MKTKKMILLLMICCFSGIFALPATMSLFSGQHTWYELESGYGSNCVKCHADIYGELYEGGHHKNIAGVADGEECLVCHRANASILYATASTSEAGQQAHAASTINCGYCHLNQTVADLYTAPPAGGFGLVTGLSNDTGTNASHYSFVVQSRTGDLLQNESESCVACHTTTTVILNFNVTTGMTVTVTNTIINDSSACWNMTNVAPSTYTTYTEEK